MNQSNKIALALRECADYIYARDEEAAEAIELMRDIAAGTIQRMMKNDTNLIAW